jgi:transcriptional regulator with AAA-type ATPase domain
MAPHGVVLHPLWTARRGSPRRPEGSRRAEALLAAIETLQRAPTLGELTERAAAQVLPLIEAAAATVYVEAPRKGPHLSACGCIDRPTADARAALVREILATGPPACYLLLGNGGTLLVARFRAGALRGAVLAERQGTAFEDADGWVLTAFAGHLGAAAAVLSTPERLRESKRLPLERPADAIVGYPRPEERCASGSTGTNALFGLADVIGPSAAMAAVRELARVAAPSSSSLFIEGESGVGKEVLAQAIHSGGPRRDRPFIAVHCAAIPRELLESEFFGYEAGAFTGASPRGRAGKFELADGGTLLLDDIVELPLELQAKLLRALQERAVTRLGADRPRPVNVRIVATANRSLREASDAGCFRPDLFYRLNVLHIVIPPLRDRPEDIGPLAEHFLRRYAAEQGRTLRIIGGQALRSLEQYSWPGNVRELEHWIEREIHFAPDGATCLERLTPDPEPAAHQRPPAIRPLREVEREVYAAAIAEAAGDLTRAARQLGVSRGKLYRKLETYGLSAR